MASQWSEEDNDDDMSYKEEGEEGDVHDVEIHLIEGPFRISPWGKLCRKPLFSFITSHNSHAK